MATKPEILIIDDETSFASLLAELLTKAGYTVKSANTGSTGLTLLKRSNPALVLLDYRLPDMSGLEVLKQIRLDSSVPIIFISGEGSDRDKVAALEQGADDFVAKPFYQEELAARITALLRRVGWNPSQEPVLETGMLRIDVTRRLAYVASEALHLTPNEFAILVTLARSTDRVVTYAELIETVWGSDRMEDLSALRVNISRLRQKLEQHPVSTVSIHTVARQGYRLTPFPPDSNQKQRR